MTRGTRQADFTIEEWGASHPQVAWDLSVAVLRPDGGALAVLAAADTD